MHRSLIRTNNELVLLEEEKDLLEQILKLYHSSFLAVVVLGH